MSKDNSGPAFPTPYHPSESINTQLPPGLSVRDYFAAKALVGFLSSPTIFEYSNEVLAKAGVRRADWMAQQVYAFADAMIVERAK